MLNRFNFNLISFKNIIISYKMNGKKNKPEIKDVEKNKDKSIVENKIEQKENTNPKNKKSDQDKKQPDVKDDKSGIKKDDKQNDKIKDNNKKQVKLEKTVVEDPSVVKKREEQSEEFKKFIEASGLPLAFNLIFGELISKHIQPENYFTYTSMRLKQLGKEFEEINMK